MTRNNDSSDLFDNASNTDPAAQFRPLADRLRPTSFENFFGQSHILDKGKPLRKTIEEGKLHSMIFWGPPGTGKTTLAKLIANYCDANFISLSAVLSGVKDIRNAVHQAEMSQQHGRASILFVDEVHRFNKSQQDAFLPHVENGTITFIGATTENPSFELNNALLSRARVYVLTPLNKSALKTILEYALSNSEQGLGKLKLSLPDSLKDKLIMLADGDARRLLNLLEITADFADDNGKVSEAELESILTQDGRRFDNQGEAFYDQISALHKSVRGSSPDAALYWFVRMLDGGCDPLYIARRVVRMASEDIGNADPRALQIALSAWDVQERLGHPEGELAIAQAVIYLACAAKSNAVYKAFNQVKADVQQQQSIEVPVHLRNAPTKLMKELGYGKAYRYAHDEPYSYAAGENYFPDNINPPEYYQPTQNGLEIKISERLNFLRQLDLDALSNQNKS